MVPPAPHEDAVKWAKADMLAMFGFDRLNLPYTGHDPVSGQRRYLKIMVTPDDVKTIRVAVIHALGLDRLTGHL